MKIAIAIVFLVILFGLLALLIDGARPINYNEPINDDNIPEEWRDL